MKKRTSIMLKWQQPSSTQKHNFRSSQKPNLHLSIQGWLGKGHYSRSKDTVLYVIEVLRNDPKNTSKRGKLPCLISTLMPLHLSGDIEKLISTYRNCRSSAKSSGAMYVSHTPISIDGLAQFAYDSWKPQPQIKCIKIPASPSINTIRN